jgi:hypothetical protein
MLDSRGRAAVGLNPLGRNSIRSGREARLGETGGGRVRPDRDQPEDEDVREPGDMAGHGDTPDGVTG